MPATRLHFLNGTTVLEISGRIAGAYCGLTLARLGADVTRVDLPLAAHVRPAARSRLEQALHLGKRSVDAAGEEVARLAASCDLVVVDVLHEDARDGAATAVAQRLLARRAARKPTVDLTQFGRQGGGLDRPGTPLVTSAAAGMSWSIGLPDREPLTLPFDVPDYLAGSEGAAAAALLLLGQQLDDMTELRAEVATADVLAYYVGMITTNFVGYGRPWHRDGPQASKHGGSYPAALFACANGAVAIMCRQPREWTALLAAMGNPAWSRADHLQDPREVARHHAEEVDPPVRAWIREQTLQELLALGSEHGFPVAPVRDVGESLDDPQYLHRGYFSGLPDGSGIRVPGIPYQVVERSAPGPDGPVLAPLGAPGAPLAGLRVLDFSWVWSGPTVTAALGDLGAEVIKVEHRGRPDSARVRGAGLRDGRRIEGPPLEVSPYFNQVNHGKKSIAIDITTSEGRDLVRRLAASCDVTVENMRPGALARRGLGYDDLRLENPAIVMLSMSVAGRDGPLAATGGYATVMSGLAGLEGLVRYADSDPMGLKNLALADPNAAGHALAVLLAAIRHQRSTGEGCWIDLSQTECVSSILTAPLIESQLPGGTKAPANTHSTFTPHGHFACAGDDAWIAVAVRTDAERDRLCSLLGRAAEGEDLAGTLAAWLRERTPEQASAALGELGIPVSPVRSFEELEEHGWAASAVTEHPFIGPQRMVALPWRVDGVQLAPRGRSPLIGEHTDEVLAELAGVRPAQRDRLRASGVFSDVEADAR
jgi:crotonobetainyl-CoA:carnitine CoA-transferase CaiB-like acyl-CoA transferase